MTAFDAGLVALFSDPHLGLTALYRASGVGDGVPVRTMRRAPDEVVPYREGRFVVETVRFDLRIAEVPMVAAGDTLELNGLVFVVLGEPTRDSERTIWQFGARAL